MATLLTVALLVISITAIAVTITTIAITITAVTVAQGLLASVDEQRHVGILLLLVDAFDVGQHTAVEHADAYDEDCAVGNARND